MSTTEKDIDLHKLLKGRVYDHVLISTFTFSPRFFEEYLLERFKALHGKGGLTVFLDRGQYEEIIEATAFGKGWSPKLANRRYLLHPIEVPGVFHSKVFLFTTPKRGLLIIGSANFSQDGLGGNAELVSVFKFELEKNEETLPLFQSAFRFFEQLSERWPGKEAGDNVDELRRDTPWLTEPNESPTSPALPVLLHNLEQPLWPQITRGMRTVEDFSLVSRFFDASPGILDKISEDLGEPRIRVHAQPKRGALAPEWLSHPMAGDGRLTIHLCQYGNGEHMQPLHGKAYTFRIGKETILAVGSANCSTSALLRSADSGNVETMLLYPPSATEGLDPGMLFDPLGTAKQVTHPDQLVQPEDTETEPVHKPRRFKHLLHEVRIDEESLLLSFEAEGPGLGCQLSQANLAPIRLPLEGATAGTARLTPPKNWLRRISESSTVAQLVRKGDERWEPVSNPVLVAALFDPESGRDARKSRRLREAVESPQRFMGILRELCEGDDEAALMSFLANCNIPFDLNLRTYRPKGRRPSGNDGPPDRFGDLGGRSLRHFEAIHDAAIAFTRRHRARLSRHIENGTARSIPNFLHILETLILLLVNQIERAREGLTADPKTTLTANQWNEIRKNLSDYFLEIEKLLTITVHDYLPVLHKHESRATINECFGETHEALLKTCSRALAARQNIAKAIQCRVYVLTELGTTKQAKFFNTLISEDKWRNYCQNLLRLGKELRAGLAA